MKGQSIIYFKAKNIKDEATIKSIEFEIFSILDEEDDKLIAVEDFGDFDVIYSFLPEYKTHKFMNILENVGGTILLITQKIDEINTIQNKLRVIKEDGVSHYEV